MSRFSYLLISDGRYIGSSEQGELLSGIVVMSTDARTMDWVHGSVAASSFRLGEVHEFPSGEKYSIGIDGLGSVEQSSVKYWLIKNLCNRGWEPFSSDTPHSEESVITYLHMKKREVDEPIIG